jgi:cysteine desulfurase/selenocysteine lyase
VALSHVSNVLGTVNPIANVVALAHERQIPVLVDGAQAAPHLRIDVQELGCDFYAVSGHKMMAPSGIGALFGREELLAGMRPWQGGGDMIRSVSFEKTTYNDPPYRFEAGTPNVAGVVGLGAAVDYIEQLGHERIARLERELLERLTAELQRVSGLRILGTTSGKVAVVSFVVEGLHAQDVATLLDTQGIAVRAGHHCAEPLLKRFGVDSTLRVSLAPFNTHEDIDRFLAGLDRARRILMG